MPSASLTTVLTGINSIGLFASRAFVSAFAVAAVLRWGPEIDWINNTGLLQSITDVPAWFTHNVTLVILGLLAGLEIAATKSADARALLAHWCRAAVATLIGQGLPGLDALPAVLERYPDHASPVDEAEWRSLREASWASHDEHVPKAVYALNQWARADVDQGDRYRAAAQTLVAPHPTGDPGEHLWFGPPQVVGGNGP